MSALRIARPGYPVVLVDLGPSVGRVSFSRVGMRDSGEYTVTTAAKPEPNRSPDKRTGAHSAKLRGDGFTCGKMLKIIGEPCARKRGHGYDCKSRADMDRRAGDRRSGVGRWP